MDDNDEDGENDLEDEEDEGENDSGDVDALGASLSAASISS